jgi:hypothetical protein
MAHVFQIANSDRQVGRKLVLDRIYLGQRLHIARFTISFANNALWEIQPICDGHEMAPDLPRSFSPRQ